MNNVITLIADHKQKNLDETIINKVFILLEKAKCQVENIKWLCPEIACDVFFIGKIDDKAREKLDVLSEKFKIDFIVQSNSPSRKKKLLISDMDSTIINEECIDEIADKLGLKDKVSKITERAMNGELDFKDALRERVALLKGLSEEKLLEVYENNISLMSGAKELVQTMRKNGAYCLLVSGGFTFFTQKIAKEVGFEENHANILEIKNGVLTGTVAEPILDKESKLASLKETVKKLGIADSDVLASGDGANDLPMIKAAGLGVAYHAKPNVKKEAQAKVDYADLRALLYAQGYTEQEIVNGR